MLTNDDFQKICRLARVQVDEANKDIFLAKLNSLFDWIKQLENIDTSHIELNDIYEESVRSCGRDDIATTPNGRSDILSNTEFKKFDMFSVPKVVE